MKKFEEYKLLVDLYKFYLGLMVSLGGFSFAIIGGVSKFAIEFEEFRAYAMLLPLFFSLGLVYIYWVSIRPAKELESSLNKLGNEDLEAELVPHAFLLVRGVQLFLCLYSVVTVVLTRIFLHYAFGF